VETQEKIERIEKVKQSLTGLNHTQVACLLYKLIDDKRWEDSYAICQIMAWHAWK